MNFRSSGCESRDHELSCIRIPIHHIFEFPLFQSWSSLKELWPFKFPSVPFPELLSEIVKNSA